MRFPLKAMNALVALSLLSACGGGGDQDLSPTDPIPTIANAASAAARAGSVVTVADARKAANLLMPLLLPNAVSVPGKAAMSDPESTAPPPRGVPAKETMICGGGGTRSDSQQTGIDVDSPYTEQGFDLNVLNFNSCKETVQTETETVVTGQTGLTRRGVIETEQSAIDYIQNGESAAAPLRIAVQRQPRSGTSADNITVTTETYGIFHRQFGTNQILRERYYYRQGLVTGSDGGQRFDGAFLIQQGVSPGSRMLVSTPAGGGLAYQGSLAMALLSAPATLTANCGNGSYTVRNLVPLEDTDTTEGMRIQGSIEISAGGRTATYVFSGNGASGTLEITAGDGSKTTISQSELSEACPVLTLF